MLKIDHQFEEVVTQFFDKDALRLPSYKVGRINYGNGRSYIKIVNGEIAEPFRLYTSLTTAIRTCAPMERGLLEWYCKLGMEEADRYVTQAMMYGSLMHMQFGEYLINKEIDLDSLEEIVKQYCEEKNYYEKEVPNWPKRLREDLLAFAAFVHECNVVPIGIEYVLLSDQWGFGTLIDLVCHLDVEEKGFFGEVYKSGPRKDQPKETSRIVRKIGLVNFKSGRHGFDRSNGLQVEAERMLFEENFPDIKIDCAYNWSPKDWETTPGYNLRNWAGDISLDEVAAVLKLGQCRFGNKAMRRKYAEISGKLTNQPESMTNVLKFISAEEYAKKKYGSTPES